MKDETLLPDEFEAFAKREGLITESHGLRFVNSAIDVARKAWNAALQSGNSAQPVTVPAGYVLVPVEFTPEMRNAWDSAPNNSDDDNVNMMAAYRAMLAAAQKAPDGWIPVSERMPEVGSTVMVFMDKPSQSSTDYAIATFDKYGFSRAKVTHWQPLPDAPKVTP